MDEASGRRHDGGGAMEKASLGRRHGKGIGRHRGGGVKEKASSRGITEEASWRMQRWGEA